METERMAVKCCLGSFLNESCSSNKASDHYELTENEKEIVKLRTKCGQVDSLCKKHRNEFLLQYSNHQRSCCDILAKHSGKKISKGLREITLEMAKFYARFNLVPGKKWCPTCRRAVKEAEEASEPTPGPSQLDDFEEEELQEEQEDADDGPFESSSVDLSLVNESLSSIGESPVQLQKLGSRKRYPEEKLDKITGAFRKKLRLAPKESRNEDKGKGEQKSSKYFDEVMQQLKDKFRSCEKRSEQLQVLTVLPKSWSIRQIESEFGTSNYMARAAKKLVEEKGILSTPNPKPGKATSEDVVTEIHAFYNSDDISRQMPGKRDCVSMNVAGEKVKVQKRLILCNLKEAYRKFKDETNIKIGFSKFASLRPKNVVLPGGSGTHSVCVCTIHQNVKLMLEGSKISSLPIFGELAGDNYHQKISYHHLIASLTCNPALPDCFLGNCELCGDKEKLEMQLSSIFERLDIDEVTYKSWVSVDRTNLETITKNAEEFISTLVENLVVLQRHAFIARLQASYVARIKEGPMEGEVLVIGDFAENYSFVLQDAAQGFHWNNSQATIHPFVIYHRLPLPGDDNTNLKSLSFVIISDCLTHDTIAVHRFQRKLIAHLKDHLPFEKVIYFSDGAASQYKNKKNFINLVYHEEDFGMPAEWHFFATSHGKGPCDGVGGTVKRLAARASLQRPYDDQL